MCSKKAQLNIFQVDEYSAFFSVSPWFLGNTVKHGKTILFIQGRNPFLHGPFAKKSWLSSGTFAIRDQGPCHTLMEPVEPACSGHVFYKLQMDRKWIEMVCNLCTLLARFMFPVSLKREKKLCPTPAAAIGCLHIVLVLVVTSMVHRLGVFLFLIKICKPCWYSFKPSFQ